MMTISELARAGGVGVETVRYYQRRNLLSAPSPKATRSTGIRHYDEFDVRRLRFIRSAQQAGFTLSEIGELLELDAGEDRARVRELARLRISALDDDIAQLSTSRDALARLARECAGSDKGPCPIIAAFENPGGT